MARHFAIFGALLCITTTSLIESAKFAEPVGCQLKYGCKNDLSKRSMSRKAQVGPEDLSEESLDEELGRLPKKVRKELRKRKKRK